MSVLRWDPFQDLLSLQDEMNQVFERVADRPGKTAGSARVWAPALDISERKDAYLVTLEVPGVHPDDIDITLENGLLTIQGERRRPEDSPEQRFHRMERLYGSFRRSVSLPAGATEADGVQASYDNGVLQLVVPKPEQAKPKKIEVRAGGQSPMVTAR